MCVGGEGGRRIGEDNERKKICFLSGKALGYHAPTREAYRLT